MKRPIKMDPLFKKIREKQLEVNKVLIKVKQILKSLID